MDGYHVDVIFTLLSFFKLSIGHMLKIVFIAQFMLLVVADISNFWNAMSQLFCCECHVPAV